VTITFDDGCETESPGSGSILRQTGFNATFSSLAAGWESLIFRLCNSENSAGGVSKSAVTR
jgi:hypothetical protein